MAVTNVLNHRPQTLWNETILSVDWLYVRKSESLTVCSEFCMNVRLAVHNVYLFAGHSYVTYGPLLNGASQVIFEGVPTYPDAGRPWAITDKYNVSILYTAPTAIRSLMSFGNDYVTKYSRKSLRILGSVGEPINPEAWTWYHDVRPVFIFFLISSGINYLRPASTFSCFALVYHVFALRSSCQHLS